MNLPVRPPLCLSRRFAMNGSVARMALAGARREIRASLRRNLKFKLLN